jgi:hypothetical protein
VRVIAPDASRDVPSAIVARVVRAPVSVVDVRNRSVFVPVPTTAQRA